MDTTVLMGRLATAAEKSKGLRPKATTSLTDLDTLISHLQELRAEIAAGITAADKAAADVDKDLLSAPPVAWVPLTVDERTQAVDAARCAIEDATRRAGEVLQPHRRWLDESIAGRKR
jgi:hypothetical protein